MKTNVYIFGKRFFTLVLAAGCIALTATGCGKRGDDNSKTEAPFSHVAATFGIIAEADAIQCLDITGEWVCNGKSTPMEPLVTGVKQQFSADDYGQLPATYSLTLNGVLNKDFQPEAGTSCHIKLKIEHNLQLINTKGAAMKKKEGAEQIMDITIKSDKLEGTLSRHFPKTYTFTVSQSASGEYEFGSMHE